MQYEILKDFSGSQDGRMTEQFSKGTLRELSDDLAAVAVKEKWARKVTLPVKRATLTEPG